MQISFRNQKLAKKFNSDKELKKEYGPEMAQVIRRRLDDLDAADCLEDLRNAPGRYHELTGNYDGFFSVDLRAQYRLLFRPEPVDSPPENPNGGLDWGRIDSVQIWEVKDTHE